MLETLGTSVLGNAMTRKGVLRAGKSVVRAGRVSKKSGSYRWKFLVLFYPLNNIEILKYFNFKARFDGAFSTSDLPRIKDGAYVINLDDKQIKGSLWVSLIIDKSTDVYLDSFGMEYIPQEVLNKIKDKSITHNIFRIQDNDSIIYGF